MVGHTVQAGGVRSAWGGRVWCVDTGMSRGRVGGPVEVLEVTAGEGDGGGDRLTILREPPPPPAADA